MMPQDVLCAMSSRESRGCKNYGIARRRDLHLVRTVVILVAVSNHGGINPRIRFFVIVDDYVE